VSIFTIHKNLDILQKKIHSYEKIYHRPAHSVCLLAVSKHQPIEKIQEAIDAGQFLFAENYLQEAIPKISHFSNQNLEWHFIGSIQRNKTKKIAELFSWVHTIADPLIAKRLNDQRPLELPPLNICLQVNVSCDPAKSGLSITEIAHLANYCALLPRLKLRGLMTILSQTTDFTEQRTEFKKLYTLYKTLRKKWSEIDTLSMGMSEDLQAAIAEGATIVRIGTKFFGKRN